MEVGPMCGPSGESQVSQIDYQYNPVEEGRRASIPGFLANRLS